MSEKIKLWLSVEGTEEIEVDRAEYEAAKAAGELDQWIDVYISDVETDGRIIEPDGTVVNPYE